MKSDTKKRHESIQESLRLGKSSKESPPEPSGSVQFWPIIVVVILLGTLVIGGYYAVNLVHERESAFWEAKKQQEVEKDLARRNQVQFAKLGFLDSFPPLAFVHDESGPLYGKNDDGSYTPLRARANTWIRYLPIKGSTILHFSLVAEGFKPHKKTISYADWFPTNEEEIALQKTYRKVELEPNKASLIPYCEDLKDFDPIYSEICLFNVYTEIIYRQTYANLLESTLERREDGQPFAKEELDNLLLRGTIKITSDTPDTKVYFLGEPLMFTNESGSMFQVRVNPETPYTFSSYGNNRPILITNPLSIRLEAEGKPSFVTEIRTTDWHCTPKDKDVFISFAPLDIHTDDEVALFHYVCDYSIHINVNFETLQALDTAEG